MTTTAKEVAIAKNGYAYKLNDEKHTAKKLVKFDLTNPASLSALKEIIQENGKASMTAYHKFLKEQFPDDVIKVKSNHIDIRGYRLTFNEAGLVVTDLAAYGRVVNFDDMPSPRAIADFLLPEKRDRRFSPVEMKQAEERGKMAKAKALKLLKPESDKKPVKSIKTPEVDDSLLKSKKRALNLLGRIANKTSKREKLFEDIPGMIDCRRLKINITLAIKRYRQGKMRFPKLVQTVKDLIVAETFEPAPVKAPKFTGLDYTWEKVTDPRPDQPTIVVDGKEMSKGAFMVKHLLSREVQPEAMPQVVKYLKGAITADELLAKPVQKDRYQAWEPDVLKNITQEQLDVLEELYYGFHIVPPYLREYKYDGLRKGSRLKVTFVEYCTVSEALVIELRQGVQLYFPEDDSIMPLIRGQKYRILRK